MHVPPAIAPRDCTRPHHERGAAAIEFALLLPVLLLILIGAMEFGYMFYTQQLITNASREGARAGIVQQLPKPTAGEIETVVIGYLTNTGIDMTRVVLPVQVVGAGVEFPNDLTVGVAYDYQFFVPGLFGLGTTLRLNAQTVMRHE